MENAIYDVSIFSGHFAEVAEGQYGGEAHGFGWKANRLESLPRYSRDASTLVIVEKGKVLIAGGIATWLFDSRGYHWQAKLGQHRLYDVTNPDISEAIKYHFNYERRSESQRNVARRNREVYEWLISLAGGQNETDFQDSESDTARGRRR